MNRINIKTLTGMGLLAVSLASCNPGNTTSVPAADSTLKPTDDYKPAAPAATALVTVKPLNCSFQFSQDAKDILVQGKTETGLTTEGDDVELVYFYLKINSICQPSFFICKIKAPYTEEELKNIYPEFTYLLSDHKTYTYASNSVKEAPADLNKKDTTMYATIRDNDVKNIKNSFQLLK